MLNFVTSSLYIGFDSISSFESFSLELTVILALRLTELPAVKSVFSISVFLPISSINALSTADLLTTANVRIFAFGSEFVTVASGIVNPELPTTSFELRRIFGSAIVV